MALGRSNLPDQGQRPGPHSSTTLTGVADQPDPSARDHTFKRDHAADRRKALEDQIAAYKAAGLDTSHLEKVLGTKKAAEAPLPAVPTGDGQTQPEPADGSAPDKREQDQTPKDPENPMSGPTDPGPEAAKRKADRLPDQPQTPTAAPKEASSVPAQEPRKEAPAAPPSPATVAQRAPAKKVPAKKAPAKRVATGR